jgi:hypothetical protein
MEAVEAKEREIQRLQEHVIAFDMRSAEYTQKNTRMEAQVRGHYID